MDNDDWLVLGDRCVLLVCCVVLVLFIVGVIH